jgi:glutathionylspermidine synthase
VTLGLLVCAAGIIYFEWRSAAKKEIVAATIIAELWNGRVSDRIEIVRRTEQFNQLVELHNQETERLLSAAEGIRTGTGSRRKHHEEHQSNRAIRFAGCRFNSKE